MFHSSNSPTTEHFGSWSFSSSPQREVKIENQKGQEERTVEHSANHFESFPEVSPPIRLNIFLQSADLTC